MLNIKQLSCDTLGDLDYGKTRVAVDRALIQVVRDCLDRPGVETARKVKIELTIEPTCLVDGQSVTCEGVKAVAKVSAVTPKYETALVDCGVRANGTAVFAPNVPHDHNQAELFDQADE